MRKAAFLMREVSSLTREAGPLVRSTERLVSAVSFLIGKVRGLMKEAMEVRGQMSGGGSSLFLVLGPQLLTSGSLLPGGVGRVIWRA